MNEKEEFIYLYDLSKYNILDFLSENEQLILQHWEFLQKLKSEGFLLFSGITLDSSYELVVVQATNRDEATELFNEDPYAELNLIEGQLYCFRASLLSNEEIQKPLLSDDFDLDSLYLDSNNLFMGTITPRSTFINDVTEEEGKIMGVHFQYLKKSFDERKLLLAGPILEEGMFGITVFLAEDIKEARKFANKDPSVRSKIMKPEIHPFRLLLRGEK
jgi:uncharacterized protein YciI